MERVLDRPAASAPSLSQHMTGLEWLLLILLSLVWGGSFFFNRVLVVELRPFTIVFFRVGLAALALLGLLRITGQRLPRSAGLWRDFFIMGMLNNLIPFSLIVWGQTQIASGLAAILNATTPLFAALIVHYSGQDARDRLTGNKLLGVVIGLAGVVLIVGPTTLSGLGLNLAAQLAVLGAAVSYGFASSFGRRFRAAGVPPLVAATGQVSATSIMAFPLMLAIDRPWELPGLPGPTIWAALIGLALLSTSLAYVIYFRLLAGAGAVNVVLVTLLIPPSALLLGALAFAERLDWHELLGMAVILAGLVVIDGRVPAMLLRRA
jgi:drug/metabolite transporter (DMT)-like permease